MAIALDGVRAGYGGIEVLHDVAFAAEPGEVRALLGPNGAGKSTLLRVMSGRLPMHGGTLVVDQHPVRKPRPERLTAAGMCCIPEGRGVFPNLTVEEHLTLWAGRGRPERKAMMEAAAARWPVLGTRRGQLAGSLSGGERQMLALSRALRPGVRALICDELSMGLAPRIVEELYEFIGGLARGGVTVVVVEQFAEMALRVATGASVLVGGRIRLSGSPDEVRAGLHDAYLGGHTTDPTS
ncbi:MAG TPA: ATP-binding cassette domain-containing protein [Acidimicrobiales bacterium]|nr:ATP-binding cassette domain-containing protein [Acidimicrobiales bacterium]